MRSDFNKIFSPKGRYEIFDGKMFARKSKIVEKLQDFVPIKTGVQECREIWSTCTRTKSSNGEGVDYSSRVESGRGFVYCTRINSSTTSVHVADKEENRNQVSVP